MRYFDKRPIVGPPGLSLYGHFYEYVIPVMMPVIMPVMMLTEVCVFQIHFSDFIIFSLQKISAYIGSAGKKLIMCVLSLFFLQDQENFQLID